MIEFLETIGKLGRKGGVILLLFASLFVGVDLALSSGAIPVSPTLEVVFYSPAVWGFGGLFGLVGLYLVVTGGAWKRDARFKPMSSEQLAAAVQGAATPFCVCLDCMVFLPYEVSVGRCPRCESSSSCLEVLNAADRQSVRNAIPSGR